MKIKNPVHTYIYDTKLAKKFLYLIVFLLLSAIVVLNFSIKNTASSLIVNEVKQTSRQFLEQYVDNIGYRISKFNTLLNSLSRNKTLKAQLEKEHPDRYDIEVLDAEIRQILNYQFPYGWYDLSFYPSSWDANADSIFIDQLPEDEDWIRYYEDQYYDKYFIHEEGSFQASFLSVLKPVYSQDGSEIICVIKLTLFPEKVFRGVTLPDERYYHKQLIIDKERNYVYGNTFSDTEEYLQFLMDNTEYIFDGYHIPDFETDSGIYITSDSSTFGYRAVYYFSYEEALGSIDALNRNITAYIVMLIILMFTAGILLSHNINRRMSLVLEKIKQVSTGNLIVDAPVPGADEIGLFDSSFSDMTVRLKKMIEDNYISEMEKKDAQFLALQAQINPHFLFNSLEIINSLIQVEQYETACITNAKLSELLRYSINYNTSGLVTIGEEIKHMENYVFIQKIRFRDKFTFHKRIEEDCLSYPIIKMIFQPFIENSIRHGFAGMPQGGNIWFSVWNEDKHLYIEIRDDGHGMDEARLASVNQKLKENQVPEFRQQTSSIGLSNIYNRMVLKYGSAFHMDIRAPKEKGTCITLRIALHALTL